MQVRSFDLENDYKDVAKWWAKQDWPVLSKDMLKCRGFIVEDNEMKLAATWIFSTGCSLYLMEWTVGNPEASWEDRGSAIKMVTDTASEWAKYDGATHIMTMTKSKRFIEKLEEYGFIKMDTDMTHLVRSL